MKSMYECPWTYRALAHVDGDCDADAALRNHVAACPACAELVRDLESDVRVLAQAARDAETNSVPMETLVERSRATVPRRRAFQLAAACAVMALTAALTNSNGRTAPDAGVSADAAWTADLARIEERINELEAITATLNTIYAADAHEPAGDDSWLEEAQTAAVFVRSAEVLERDYALYEPAQSRYRTAARYFGDTWFGREASRRIVPDEIVNEG